MPPLFRQTYPIDRYEIILVDDGSSDDTASRAMMLARAHQYERAVSFRLIQKPNGGPASARNAGWLASKAEVVAFIDSDCEASESWLMELVAGFTTPEIAGVGGPILDPTPCTVIADYVKARRFFTHRVRGGRVDYLLTGNAAFRREALLAVDGFDEAVRTPGAEDPDLSFRIQQQGYRLAVTSTGAVLHHGVPPSVRGFLRTVRTYGEGNALLSGRWQNGRTPLVEFVRHGGAIVLSPIIAIRLARGQKVGVALRYWLLVIAEHSAFLVGLIGGLRRRAKASHTGSDAFHGQ